MSSNRVLALALHVLFVLAACMYASEASFFPPPRPPPPPPPPPRQNNTMTFYLQVNLANGTNDAVANAFAVAGIQGKAWNRQQFGTVIVVDANITTTPSPNSPGIGKYFATIAVVALNGLSSQASSTVVFTSGPFNGSTMVIQGTGNASQQVRNIPIVGGTKNLTSATGYAMFQTISEQQNNVVVKVTAIYKFAA